MEAHAGGVVGKGEGGVSDGFGPREARWCRRQSLHREAREGRPEVSGLILPFLNRLFPSVNINPLFCKEAIRLLIMLGSLKIPITRSIPLSSGNF